jgi:hypothetical protein
LSRSNATRMPIVINAVGIRADDEFGARWISTAAV